MLCPIIYILGERQGKYFSGPAPRRSTLGALRGPGAHLGLLAREDEVSDLIFIKGVQNELRIVICIRCLGCKHLVSFGKVWRCQLFFFKHI